MESLAICIEGGPLNNLIRCKVTFYKLMKTSKQYTIYNVIIKVNSWLR